MIIKYLSEVSSQEKKKKEKKKKAVLAESTRLSHQNAEYREPESSPCVVP